MNGLQGGQGRDARDLTDTVEGMGIVMLWVAAAVLMVIAIAEVL